ncbi:MAG: glycosyltransferase family 87 protein, partial [Candidatus Methylomirabilaceae bacterium]
MPEGVHPAGARLRAEDVPPERDRATIPLLVGIGLLSTLVYLSFARETGGLPPIAPLFPFRKAIIPRFLLHFLLLFALYLVALWWAFRRAADRLAIAITLLVFSVAFRAILLWTPPVLSDDIYRYLWDGRVHAAGISPYLYPPEAPQLSHLRDEAIYPRINRAWAPTIYPPGAQWLFRAAYAAGPDSLPFLKTTIVAGDILTIVLLMLLLRTQGLPAGRAILYAWHPLAVVELAGSGHLDGLMLPFLLLALLLAQHRRAYQGSALLGVATGIKLYPALLMPALVRRHGLRLLPPFAAVIGLLYLSPVTAAGTRVLGFLPQYLSDPGERFNSGPGAALAYGLGALLSRPGEVVVGALIVALLVVGLRGTKTKEQGFDATVAETLLLVGTLVTFAQTVHPWYLVWVLPLVAIRPSA